MNRPQIIDRSRDEHFMRLALDLARQGAEQGEVPVGALLVQDGEVVGQGFNCPILRHDPSAHAEMVAIRAAAQSVQNYRLPGSTLYVTLEPCSMCAGLIVHARIARVVYAASEPRAGMAVSQGRFFEQAFLNHRVMVEGGLLAEESGALLKTFFKARRG
ncbi:tRNA-specific adenosine deaminase [Pseudomonas sp. 8Z]|uniref:tRNA adenosine(34) deaminase TadA n=1 Tax=Pseudomonas sp. 8Z TaxID=2653166 RepID=UPI0012EFF753|nr:tRNA adenosine(34) deaminase TadA [Pseudomonas sp. 8Z]VXC76909.1 tRNA-specific adenosine deaminase [Pseudomonas sp. 8Z]